MIHEKQTNLDELKEKHDDLLEKIVCFKRKYRRELMFCGLGS